MQVKAIFIYSGQTSDAELASHSGQRCEVIRPLPATEVDKENQPMFEIRFDDGLHGHAFCEELTELPDYPLIDLESFKVYLDGIESHRRGIAKRDNPWYEATLLNTRVKRTYYAIWNRGWDEAEKAGYEFDSGPREYTVKVVEVRHVTVEYVVEAHDEDEARWLAESGETVSEWGLPTLVVEMEVTHREVKEVTRL